MKSEGWIDVQIRTAVDVAELLGMLADPVIQGGWEEKGGCPSLLAETTVEHGGPGAPQ